VGGGGNGGEIDPTAPPPPRPCSPLFYLCSPAPPALLPAPHHPQPHVLLRPQRRAPGTAAAAALSTGTERGREGRLRGGGETNGGLYPGTEASDGGGCGAGAQAGREAKASEGDGPTQ
jgi:hypothetical protein